MNSKVLLVLRIFFGLFLVFFGANKFGHWMQPPGEMTADMQNYFGALTSTKTITLVAIVEIVAGLSLLFNKYVPLLMIILMSVSINAVLYHVTLDPDNTLMAGLMLILNIIMLYAYKHHYRELLN
ncbi:DoxX family membrane protein [Urechidicola croceus]|uniref:DoxX family protein n=1 Tax=Urechidicola croceus TaxID=1850246 RepID=A0A1D8P569_9FLAO|nr:DoxX family membrane protein [Urechidicola croceus]AOW19727.1 DoxX family protein [Urechidicola croceus]